MLLRTEKEIQDAIGRLTESKNGQKGEYCIGLLREDMKAAVERSALKTEPLLKEALALLDDATHELGVVSGVSQIELLNRIESFIQRVDAV